MLVLLGKLSKSFLHYLEADQLEHVLIADAKSKVKIQESKSTVAVEKVDFGNYETVLECVKKYSPSAIITDYEHYIRIASRLNQDLGLPGLPIDTAHACTDKNLMRQMFKTNDPDISPSFKVVSNRQDLIDFMESNSYPVMLKPTNLVKSLFITKNNDQKTLLQNYDQMVAEMPDVYKKLNVREKPEIIIEGFLSGSMHTVAGFADSDGEPHVIDAIADIETGLNRGSDENYLYSRMIPSNLSAEKQSSILDVAKRGMKALRMKNSAAHVEVMLTDEGPKVIEIGARPGGYRPRMYSIARGINFYKAFIDAASGQPINLESSKADATATIEIFPEKQGIISQFTGKDKLSGLKSLAYLSFRIKEGIEAGLPSQGFKSAIIVTLAGSQEQVIADKAYIDNKVRVIVE